MSKRDLSTRRSNLSQTKQALLEKLLRGRAAGAVDAPSIPRRPEHDRAPLSFSQQRLWFLDQLVPGNPFYIIPAVVRLTGSLDVAALEQSLNRIVARHEILRTSFVTVDGQPAQIIAPALTLQVPVTDLGRFDDREEEAMKLAAREAQQPFDLGQGPLIRVKLLRLSEDEHILLLMMHHIISDEWSIGVLLREMGILYEAFKTGSHPALPDLPAQYGDFAIWQQKRLQGEAFEKQLSYWKQQLEGIPPVLELPTDQTRPPIPSFRGGKQWLSLSSELTGSLKQLSDQQGATLFMTLLGAFATLLHRYTGQRDIAIGSPIASRNQKEVESLIGCFINTLVLRTDISGNPTFVDLLDRVKKVALGAYANQDLPFEKIVEELQPERDLSRNPLFNTILVFQNVPMPPLELPGLILRPVEVHNDTAKLDLTLSISETATGLIGYFEYSKDLFSDATISRMISHFQILLEAIIAAPHQTISTLPLLPESERQTLIDWNNTGNDFRRDECLHQLFESQVERTPHAIALVYEQQRLTYSELNRRANQLAHHLRKLGVGPEARVAICLDRSIEMLVAIVAILKAGAAYLPLDPAYPKERLAFILDDARATVLVTQRAMAQRLPSHTALIVELDTSHEAIAQESQTSPDPQASAENPAYVIYTSGSTGKPKGVVVTHANVTRLFEATRHWFEFNETDVWTLFHSYAFDFSVWEMWGALLYGGRLVVVARMTSRTPEAFYELLVREHVTVLNQTPSAFRQLMRVDERVEGQKEMALRVVIFGGEALEVKSLKGWMERHGEENPVMVNMYGITETTVHVTYRRIRERDVRRGAGSVIGGAIEDLQVMVLDEEMEPVPIGVAGEMYVGGEGVGRGYMNGAGLTGERFIPNPYSRKGGGRLYKTGDVAKYVGKGELEYLGRADQQVKVRGYRIELGEIEAVMMEHSAIRESIVMAREEADRERRLVGYVVAKEEGELTTDELRAYLKEKLPDHMVPAVFVMMKALPLTANGKIDRRALPAPENQRPALGSLYIEPHTEMEKVIAAVWLQVLRVEKVGVHDNFFDLGGDSFLMAQACSKLREALNRDISMVEVFTYTSINSLAKYLSRAEVESHVRRQSSAQVETRKESMKQREQFRKQLRAKSKP